jgi:hypothetical protein
MTLRQWGIRLLNNSDRRMAQNPLFIAYLFDQLSLAKACSAINVSVKFHPEINRAIASVTEEEMKSFLHDEAHRDVRVRQGIRVGRSGAGKPELLMRGVDQAAARIYGSNGETKRARELAHAIATHYGLPQVFFTINFNTSCTATLAYCSGNLEPQVKDKRINCVH